MGLISNTPDFAPPFSYLEYRQILHHLSAQFPIIDYGEIDQNTENFCVIRHDIEFSVERALKLAEIEHQMGIRTSYFVQLNNNTYNPLSSDNLAIITQIHKLGHRIGIHFTPSSSDKDFIEKEFFELKTIFEHRLGITIDRFSFHRPNLNPGILRDAINIDGIINVYGELFFQYFEGSVPVSPQVKYMSDSNHQWKYGHPLDDENINHQKLQLLIHPFSWSERGGNNLDNYLGLIKEKNDELIRSINSEISNFPIDEINQQ